MFEDLTTGYQRQLESGIAALHELLGAMERTVIEQSTRLEHALKLAHQASRAKSEFLSTMSHELRTPMNVVLGMADMLKETELAAEQRHYLEVMVSNGNSLMDLINSVLDLARIESGRLELEQHPFHLSELLDRTVATFAVQAHSKGVELVARVAPGTPAHLIGDEMRLRQIIVNLVANAIKFTAQGAVVLEVEATHHDNFVQVAFAVSDTGIGIAKENLRTIFSKFTQADSSITRKYGGSGLGLAIAKRLTDLMHGEISVSSAVGAGSCFRVSVPLQLPADAPAVSKLPDLSGLRLLVVDDHRLNRLLVRDLLAQSHAWIAESSTHEAAIGAIRKALVMNKPYQIVLLDMRMPNTLRNGIELVEMLEQHQLPTKSIVPMLYSDDIATQVVALKRHGIETYLLKPITSRGLYRAIERALEKAEGQSPYDRLQKLEHQPALSLDGRRMKILIAEDSPDNRLVIESFLHKEPCSLTFVRDGAEAINRAFSGDYDLIFMDIQMPNTDGLTATRVIRRWESEAGRKPIPIIALTASALEEDITRSLQAGCDSHISKPVRKRVILDAIRNAAMRVPPQRVVLQ